MNHADIGDKYIGKYGKDRIYARGTFWQYDNGTWSDTDTVRDELWELCKGMKNVSPTRNLIGSVVEYVTGKLRKRNDELDSQSHLLNLRNGVLSLKSMSLMPHKREYYFTSQLGFDYNAKATCPTWLKFIAEVLVMPDRKTDNAMIDFMQEAFGYSMTASVEHEISFWMIGEGSNGKSTICRILKALGGSATHSINLGTLDRNDYQLSDLPGKRIIICTESPQTTVADSTVKAIVSGDEMNVRQIRGKPFVIRPIAKVWWAMNNPPRVNDTSEGFWRKMKVIPFNRTFAYEERDRQLFGKLNERELSGIFNWALVGLKRLEANGYFTECEQIEDATHQYRSESDLPKQFADEECNVTANAYEDASLLYARYNQWCKDNGHRAASSNRMGREWRRLGFRPDRVNGKRVWLGVELLSRDTIDTLSKNRST